MATVEVSRFVPATPRALERLLDPETLLGYEGTFRVHSVEETEAGWLVVADAGGVETHLGFERRADGLAYEQLGGEGPFESMRTTLTVAPENEGARVTLVSEVSLGLPLAALSDRVAAWKRRAELKRTLDRLTADA
jgi:hypothetical protein